MKPSSLQPHQPAASLPVRSSLVRSLPAAVHSRGGSNYKPGTGAPADAPVSQGGRDTVDTLLRAPSPCERARVPDDRDDCSEPRRCRGVSSSACWELANVLCYANTAIISGSGEGKR